LHNGHSANWRQSPTSASRPQKRTLPQGRRLTRSRNECCGGREDGPSRGTHTLANSLQRLNYRRCRCGARWRRPTAGAPGEPWKTDDRSRLALGGLSDYAPAAGRLAAAMATICARRRRIRDGAVRSNELIRRMVQFLLRRCEQPSATLWRTRENGASPWPCRGAFENSNARFAGPVKDSGFVAANGPAAVEIFSVESTLSASR
jgi:hypothetical protein